jgi:hypothetical protein
MINCESCGSLPYAMNAQVILAQGAATEVAERQVAPEVAASIQAQGAAVQASQSRLDVFA